MLLPYAHKAMVAPRLSYVLIVCYMRACCELGAFDTSLVWSGGSAIGIDDVRDVEGEIVVSGV